MYRERGYETVGGSSEVLSLQQKNQGGRGIQSLSHAEGGGGHKTFWVSFNMGHTQGRGTHKVSTP